MDIRSIVVGLDIDSFAPDLVKCAGALAARLGAELTGVAAAEPAPPIAGFDGGVSAAFHADERDNIETRLRALEDDFRALVPDGVPTHWRAYIDAPTNSLAANARGADLIMIAPGEGKNFRRNIDAGDLLLTAGRPVLVTGAGVEEIWAETVVIGWKDKREARRAVADALPFLQKARDVVAVAVREDAHEPNSTSMTDLLAWLRLHGVAARAEAVAPDANPAAALQKAATDCGADLLVTGAYGHSRTREWLFGGTTRDLLAAPLVSRLMSN